MKLEELQDTEAMILASPMNEMVNLSSKETGLAVVIWFGEVGGQHGPKIKVSNLKGKFAANDNFVISVDKDPVVLTMKSMKLSQAELNDVLDWVKLNYDDLMKLWCAYENDEPTIEILANLKKI